MARWAFGLNGNRTRRAVTFFELGSGGGAGPGVVGA